MADKNYLCFTANEDSTISMEQPSTSTPHYTAGKVLQYKINDGKWQKWDLSMVRLRKGEKMYIKSDDTIPMGESNGVYKRFVMRASIAASGNIMSLLNFKDTVPEYAFYCLFEDCKSLTQAPELPITDLYFSFGCYFVYSNYFVIINY